ncbi:MAG: HEPN domain-containing protein [Snowella sp.]|nr:HEPN domain-containing protein [Snowella sp.]
MNSVPHKLLEKARKSLDIAKNINELGSPDFAVSRAYYVMFYIATAFLETENLSFSKHSGVISAFGKYFAKTGKVPKYYHRYLIEAEKLRTAGDYSLDIEITQEDAEDIISKAEEMLIFATQELL